MSCVWMSKCSGWLGGWIHGWTDGWEEEWVIPRPSGRLGLSSTVGLLSFLDPLLPSVTRIQDLPQKHVFSPSLKLRCFCSGTSTTTTEGSSLGKSGTNTTIHYNPKQMSPSTPDFPNHTHTEECLA